MSAWIDEVEQAKRMVRDLIDIGSIGDCSCNEHHLATLLRRLTELEEAAARQCIRPECMATRPKPRHSWLEEHSGFAS